MTQPVASRNCSNLILCLCLGRLSKAVRFPLLRASAHVFFSPAMCVTLNVTWCRAAKAAASLRNEPRGSAVLHSRSRPASVGELSDALGNANDHCCDAQCW